MPTIGNVWFPVAPGVTSLPQTPASIDTSPSELIGSILIPEDNPQTVLNLAFPSTAIEQGVLNDRNSDIWKFNGNIWINVGPAPIGGNIPSEIIGSISIPQEDPQVILNDQFPLVTTGQGILNENDNNIWKFDGSIWTNVGPTPGITLNPETIIGAYNEIVLYDAKIKTFCSLTKFNYALHLETIVPDIETFLDFNIQRVVVANAGNYSLFVPDIKQELTIIADTGNYNILGQSSRLRPEYLAAEAGSVSFSGEFAEFTVKRFVSIKIGAATPLLGSNQATDYTGWTLLRDAIGDVFDDDFVQTSTWPFTFTMSSTPYSSAYVGSNSYLTFGGGSTNYIYLNQGNPPFDKISFKALDRSYQRVFQKIEINPSGEDIVRIRYEGFIYSFGTIGSPTVVVEFAFYKARINGEQWVEMRVGRHDAPDTGYFAVCGPNLEYAAGPADGGISFPNSSWVFIGNSTGTSWTMTPDRYLGFTVISVSIEVPTGSISVNAHEPAVVGGASVSVPSVDISLQGILPDLVGRQRLELNTDVTTVNIGALTPIVSTGINLVIPNTGIAIAGQVLDINPDAYFSSVSLLLHMDGSNGSTSFADNSNNTFTVTANGNAQISTTQSKFGGSSGYFDGSGDYLETASTIAASFGTGDFTIELWIYPLNTGGSGIIEARTGSTATPWIWYIKATTMQLELYDGTSYTTSTSLPINQWSHIAITRQSGILRQFINGISGYSGTVTTNLNVPKSTIFIMRSNDGSIFNGYIDDFRITKVCRYTSTFTLPTAAFSNTGPVYDSNFSDTSLLLHMDGSNGSTTFEDNSSNTFTITTNGNAQISTTQSKFGGSSAYFDGNGDYLTLPDSSLWDLSTDFTIESWIYLTAYSNSYSGYYGAAIVSQYNSVGSGNTGWQLRINGTSTAYNTINVYTGVTDLNFSTSIGLNQWTHIAVSRQGSSIRAFVNGIQAGSTITNSDSFTESGSRPLYIGALNDSGYRFWFNGYIDDLRVTKAARYTANFAPVTAAFPNTGTPDLYFSSVSLLLHMDGNDGSTSFTDSSSAARTITANGNAQISTVRSKYGGASALFDGSGDYLVATIPDGLGTDFTVEFWYYKTANSGWIFNCRSTGSGADGFDINWTLDVTTSGAYLFGPGSYTPASNTWMHVAITRSSNTLRRFVDGTLQGSITWSQNLTGSNFNIGGNTNSAGNLGYLTGNIDDFRITRGVARYTSAFTPPTAAFPNTGSIYDPYFSNVSLLLHMDGTNGSTIFIDKSSNSFAITPNGNAQISTAQSKFGGASGAFDGTTDYITAPASSSFALFAGDFTVEFWVNVAGTTLNQCCIQLSTSGTERANISIVSGLVALYTETGGNNATRISGTAPSANTWAHIAWVRSGSTSAVYLDGTSLGTASSAPYPSGNMLVEIGANSRASGATCVNGYIDDLRITKICRYTSTFTPPTTAFPNI